MTQSKNHLESPLGNVPVAIKALPTVYRGIQFRSRLEARWAMFYDELKISFEYEREGYDLGNGIWYLPDFWIPSLECWIEIKPMKLSREENRKCMRLVEATGFPCYAFTSGFVLGIGQSEPPIYADYFSIGCWDCNYCWCECPTCGGFGIQFEGRSDRLKCKECYLCCDARRLDSEWMRKLHGEGLQTMIEKGKHHLEACSSRGGCPRSAGNGDKGYTDDSYRLQRAYETVATHKFI